MSKTLAVGVSVQLLGWKLFVFSPKNPSKLVSAGEESQLLVGIKNEGDSSINVIAIQASIYLAYAHSYLVQNLSAQGSCSSMLCGQPSREYRNNIHSYRLLTMRQFLHQLKVLSLTYMLLASSFSLVHLISWGQLSMRLTRIHTKVLSTMRPLKLMKRVDYSVLSQFSCFALESPLLVFSFSGRVAKYNKFP